MGRFFDRLCSVAERQYPSKALKGYLQRATLLSLPETDGEPNRERLVEHFRLPFPVTAVEDENSCVLLVDDVAEQVGLRCTRILVECSSADPDEGDEEVERLREASGASLPRGAVQIVVSRFTDVLDSGRYVAEMGFGLVASKADLHMHPDSFKASALSSGWWAELTIAHAAKAQEVVERIALGQRERWLNEVPARQPRNKKQKNGPEFLRTHERSHYTLLTTEEMDAE